MKILRTTATFYPHVTGPAYQAYRVSEGMENRGHESPIITTEVLPEGVNPGHPPGIEQGSDFAFDVIRRKPWISIDQYRLSPTVFQDGLLMNYDIIHGHGYHNALKDMLYSSNLIRRKPFVLHGHDSFSKSQDPTLSRSFQYRVYDKIWGRTASGADAIVASTEQERQEMIDFGIEGSKIAVIPVGKSPAVYSPGNKRKDDKLSILFVGRLAPRRNVEMLVESVADTRTSALEVRIVGGEDTLTGSEDCNYLRKLERLSSKLDLNDKISFVGSKYGDELIDEYRRADVFVNPSHYENFGQTTLEAAFCGLPIVATSTGVAPDIIRSGGCGAVVASEEEMTAELNEYIENPNQAERDGQKAREHAVENYRWDAILDQYESLYTDLVNDAPN